MQRPEPALILGAATIFVYPADTPLAAEDAVVDVVLVDAMAKAGRAHREGHRSRPLRSECHRGDFAGPQVFHRDIAVWVSALEEFSGRDRHGFDVAVRAWLAVDRDFELCAGHPSTLSTSN